MDAQDSTSRTHADICHCGCPRHYHRDEDGASPVHKPGVGACLTPCCECPAFQPVGAPRSSDGLGIVHRALHGEGERYYVVLGTHGFWILDSQTEATDGSPAVVEGVFASKSAARVSCDGLNLAAEADDLDARGLPSKAHRQAAERRVGTRVYEHSNTRQRITVHRETAHFVFYRSGGRERRLSRRTFDAMFREV